MTPEQQKEIDRLTFSLLQDNNGGGLLTPLLASQQIIWTTDMPHRAATDGVRLWFHSDLFLQLPPKTRYTILRHELEHVARGHSLRMDTRTPKRWNYACDYAINVKCYDEGMTFAGTSPLLDAKYRGMSEEAIYELLPDESQIPDDDDNLDLRPTPKKDIPTAIETLERMTQMAKLAPGLGVSGEVELLITRFRNPRIAWQTVLHKYLTQFGQKMASYARPNRRAPPGTVLPTLLPAPWGALEHLAYFFDMSMSTSDEEVEQFVSEARHIFNTFKPKRMTFVCFDTSITKVIEVKNINDITSVSLEGRGGTDLACVHTYIEEHAPTAAIVFSDMECYPMEPLTVKTDVFWAIVRNPDIEVPFGTKLYLGEIS